MSTHPRLSIAVAALLLLTTSSASAVQITVNHVGPFNTSLGTLNSATVFLDPYPTTVTASLNGLSPVPSHVHLYQPPPVTVPGLSTFNFPSTQTSVGSAPSVSSHDHSVDPLPSVQQFSGPGLAWFLNPGNPTYAAFSVPSNLTTTNEGHYHYVSLGIVPARTTFDYTPVPEPGSVALVGLGGLALLRRRRR